MQMKWHYTWKYLLFRGFPVMFIMLSLTCPLLCISHSLEKQSEVISLILLCICVFFATIGYFLCCILRFHRLIHQQEKRYGIRFCDDGAVTISILTHWIILTDRWLIQPGKLALCRKHIARTSLVEYSQGKGGIRHKVRLITKTGNAYYLRFYDIESAKRIQKWAAS